MAPATIKWNTQQSRLSRIASAPLHGERKQCKPVPANASQLIPAPFYLKSLSKQASLCAPFARLWRWYRGNLFLFVICMTSSACRTVVETNVCSPRTVHSLRQQTVLMLMMMMTVFELIFRFHQRNYYCLFPLCVFCCNIYILADVYVPYYLVLLLL
jgi:hypothetical protein